MTIPEHAAEVPGFTPYTFAQPGSTAELMPSWPRLHESFPLLHGYSRLGHVFVSDAAQQQFAVIYPLEGGMKTYAAGSPAEFRQTVTDNPDFQAWIMPASHVAAIVAHVGPISPDQVYMPVPYPMLGGSGAPETYSSGDVWVFLEIVGQIWLQG